VIFKNVESLISVRIVPSNNFHKVPSVGYGCWTNAISPIDPLYPKAGLKLDEGELTLRLEDSFGNDTNNIDKFKVHVRVVYTYRISFKDYPKTEAERNSKGIEIETSGDL
jgi:hypothetical protein